MYNFAITYIIIYNYIVIYFVIYDIVTMGLSNSNLHVRYSIRILLDYFTSYFTKIDRNISN